MIFNKTQKDLLKKAYRKKRFTKDLYNMVMSEDITVLNKKLNKIGYTIRIKLEEKNGKEQKQT